MVNKQTIIGEIDSINGNIVSIKLNNNIKSHMPIIEGVVYKVGQIGSFLKVTLGYANLYGIVTQIGSAAIPENLKNCISSSDNFDTMQWISLALVGEQVGTRFERGITQFPTTGDKVHLVTRTDLDIIYGGYNEKSSITVGNVSVSESLEAKMDLNKLVSRHCAVVGSTGSGKSNTVSVILEAIAKKNYKSSRIVMIDPHGEYGESLKKQSKTYKVNVSDNESNELYIPFWALPFNELLQIFSGNLSETNREYVREKIIEKKKEGIKINCIDIDEDLITADSPIPFSIKQVWFELDDFERKTYKKDKITECLEKKGDAQTLKSSKYEEVGIGSSEPFLNNAKKGITSFLDRMKMKIRDSRYKFLFECGDLEPDITGKIKGDLNTLIYEWIGSEQPITILDLSGIPSEVMISMSGALLKIIYDTLFWGQNTKIGGKNQPLLFVLDEAHIYLKSGEESIASRTVQTIAKEGRKYGAGLMLVTQRPSELDETVLSQCGTIIALRMNNSKDRSYIKGAIQDELQSMIDLLSSLRTGEGIMSGEALKIPTRVKFYKKANDFKSSDPEISEKWSNELPKEDEYKKMLNCWRKQILKTEDK